MKERGYKDYSHQIYLGFPSSFSFNMVMCYLMTVMLCLEVWRERRVEWKGVKGRRGEGNGYPFLLFGCFKN